MSFIGKIRSIDALIGDFDDFTTSIGNLIKEVRPRTNILNTRIGDIKKGLLNIENLSDSDAESLLHIASKYLHINKILKSKAKFNKKDLLKIIECSLDFNNDKNQKYNDMLFELSIGSRFLNKSENIIINFDTDCDVIINNEIAIECKYAHSKKELESNIKIALEQVEKRIDSNLAKLGIVALDLSNLIDHNHISEFFGTILKRFISNYKSIEKRTSEACDVGIISNDKNFQRIISSYLSSEIEALFYSNIDLELIKNPVIAVIYQASIPLNLRVDDQYSPLISRGLAYFINQQYPDEVKKEITSLIHNLVTGI